MGTEMVMVDEIPFPPQVNLDNKLLSLMGHAPVDKVLRVVVIKEIKGSQYGVQLENSVRDLLAEVDKYEEEEEAALEKVVDFFQSKYFKKSSVITFSFPANTATAKIVFENRLCLPRRGRRTHQLKWRMQMWVG
uniref:Chalcone-flavonone isomerase family protein n=1 Tax=Ipomoea nil TaxID=35883 RepID=X5IEV6_IPONI|nr:chalcone-flavanone isomerase family protein [Ipomoea nil]